jgi:hypothetical protein
MSILTESKTQSSTSNKAHLNRAFQIMAGLVLAGLAAVLSILEIITQLRKQKSVSIPIEVSRK